MQKRYFYFCISTSTIRAYAKQMNRAALHFIKNRTALLFCLLMFGIVPSGMAQQRSADSLTTALTSVFEQSGVPGCAVVIVNRNGIIYQNSFGYADVTYKKPFTSETRINIASVSKTVVAAALMKAIELGYFSLETDINTILPFKLINPYVPSAIIRVKHLVTHTSGITDNDSIYAKTYRFIITDSTAPASIALINEAGLTGGLKDTTLKDFMFSYLNSGGRLYSKTNFISSKPGTHYNYSNIASALAAYLIELVSNSSFSSFTENYIFKPLRMRQSHWNITTERSTQRAVPYYNADTSFPFYTTITYPDGGLITSASELSRFVQEMIRLYNGSSVLFKTHQAANMFHPFFAATDSIINYDPTRYNNGVFWELYPDGFIGHPGADPGVSAFIEFNKDVGILFLGNAYINIEAFKAVLKKYAHHISIK